MAGPSSGNASGSGSNSASFMRSPWATPHASPQDVATPAAAGAGAGGAEGDYFPEVSNNGTARPINWADSELLNSISAALPNSSSQNSSQSNSRHSSPATSRPGSRPSSRPSSRPTSRASSPVRGESTNHPDAGPRRANSNTNIAALGHDSAHHAHPPQPHRSSSSFLGSMHLPKPLRPFTALSHNNSHASGGRSGSSTPALDEGRSHSTGNLAGFFGHHNSHAHGRPDLQMRQSSSSTPQHSPPLSRTGTQVHASTSGSASSGDVAAQTIAALEAHQQEQLHGASGRKGKGRVGFSLGGKGKGRQQKAGMFSSMHAHEDDDHHDDHHDTDSHHGADDDHPVEEPEDATGARYLSQVPSYEIAARGFLGGGVVPISIGLPSYEQSEDQSRPTSPVSSSAPGHIGRMSMSSPLAEH